MASKAHLSRSRNPKPSHDLRAPLSAHATPPSDFQRCSSPSSASGRQSRRHRRVAVARAPDTGYRSCLRGWPAACCRGRSGEPFRVLPGSRTRPWMRGTWWMVPNFEDATCSKTRCRARGNWPGGPGAKEVLRLRLRRSASRSPYYLGTSSRMRWFSCRRIGSPRPLSLQGNYLAVLWGAYRWLW